MIKKILSLIAGFYLYGLSVDVIAISEYDLSQETVVTEALTTIGPGFISGFTPFDVYQGYAFGVYQDAELRPWVFKVNLSNPAEKTVIALDQRTDYHFQDGSTGYYKMLDDVHHTLSLIVDGDGYIHVTADMHNYPTNPSNQTHLPLEFDNSTIIYWRSTEAFNITDFQYLGNAGGDHAPKGFGFTYQRMMRDLNGNIYLSTRNIIAKHQGYRGSKGSALTKYDVKKKAWELIGGSTGLEDYPHIGMTWEDNGESGGQYTKDIPNFVFDSRNRMHYVSSILNSDFDYLALAADNGLEIGKDIFHYGTHGIYLQSPDLADVGAQAQFAKADDSPILLPARVEDGAKQGDIFWESPGYTEHSQPVAGIGAFVSYDGNNNPITYINSVRITPGVEIARFLSHYENGQWNRYEMLDNGSYKLPNFNSSSDIITDQNGVITIFSFRYAYRMFHPGEQMVRRTLGNTSIRAMAKSHFQETGVLYYSGINDLGEIAIYKSSFTTPDLASLELVGEHDLILKAGETYSEAGFTASDITDGDLSSSVIIDYDGFDPSNPDVGEYEIAYQVTNSQGSITIEKRYITIVSGPEIALFGNEMEILTGDNLPRSEDYTDFGIIAATTNVEKSFTIKNFGSELSISGSTKIKISGSTDFTCVQQAPAKIAGGAEAVFTIRFSPSSAGLKTAEVRIVNNDADESDYRFTIEAASGVNTVKFISDGTPGVIISGNVEQRLTTDETSSAVSVSVPSGYSFSGWAGVNSSMDNPLVLSNINMDQTLVAQFMPTPVLEHDFNDNNSVVLINDISGHGNNATIMKSPSWKPGYEGLAFDFEAGAYLQNNTAELNVTEEFTFSARIFGGESANLTASRLIFEAVDSNGDRAVQVHVLGDSIRMNIFGMSGYERVAYILPDETYVKGSWQHWSFTRSAKMMKLYLNGIEVARNERLTVGFLPIVSYVIGARNGGGLRYPAAFDDVKIFNKSLNSTQAYELYLDNATSPYSEMIVAMDGQRLTEGQVYDFSGVKPGERLVKTFILHNNGTVPLYFPADPMSITGSYKAGISPEFSFIAIGERILAAGQSTSFSIAYSPLHYGASEAFFQLNTEMSTGESLGFSLHGEGTTLTAPANNTPVFTAISVPSTAEAMIPLSISAAVTDVDGDPLTYTWSQVSGSGTASFSDASNFITSIVFDTEGSYTIQIVVSDGSESISQSAIVLVEPLDSDDDGLSDEDEINIYGTDPTLFDTDSDGVGDGDEVAVGTDPLVDESSSISASLIAYYRLDENTGTIASDISGHANDAELTVEAWDSGQSGAAIDTRLARLVLPDSIATQIDQEITISFWAKGDADLANNSIVYAVNSSGKRKLNIHLPYGGNKVYFDAGYDGSRFDRLSGTTPAQYIGIWNHWAFTKNSVTGEMKTYLNGVIVLSATGRIRSMADITKFIFGSKVNGTNVYRGLLDDISIFNRALNAEQIMEITNGNIFP